MPKHAFFSFHYQTDNWRASQVRNMGVVDGNKPANDNDWETVKKGGDAAIQKWIDDQLEGRSCTVVLIGAETASRKWINYEIETSWNSGKGVLGINVHHLKNVASQQSSKGKNPFETFTMKNGQIKLSSIVRTYDPPYSDSQRVYDYIKTHLSEWIDEAIAIRKAH